jgi:hypothetical protein
VAGFLNAIGYDAYDVGPLSEGWRYQRDTPAYGTPYLGDSGADSFNVPGSGRPVSAEKLRGALAEAVRYRDM